MSRNTNGEWLGLVTKETAAALIAMSEDAKRLEQWKQIASDATDILCGDVKDTDENRNKVLAAFDKAALTAGGGKI